MRLAFSPKLRLAPLWPAVVALVTVTALGLAAMPGILTRAATDDLVSTVRLLAPGFRVPASPPYDELEREVRALAAGGDRRITVIALDGTVIADSDRTPVEVRQMENHRHRPEVEAALATGEGTATRHSDTLDREMVYAARRVVAPGGPRAASSSVWPNRCARWPPSRRMRRAPSSPRPRWRWRWWRCSPGGSVAPSFDRSRA